MTVRRKLSVLTALATRNVIDTSDTPTIFRRLTSGSYEKIDEISVRPTNTSTTIEIPSRAKLGRT